MQAIQMIDSFIETGRMIFHWFFWILIRGAMLYAMILLYKQMVKDLKVLFSDCLPELREYKARLDRMRIKIREVVRSLEIGEAVSFPISKSGSVITVLSAIRRESARKKDFVHEYNNEAELIEVKRIQ